MSNSNIKEAQEEEERKKLKSQILHYREKYEVQQKRIEYLKQQNEELKEKVAEDGEVSRGIKEQN